MSLAAEDQLQAEEADSAQAVALAAEFEEREAEEARAKAAAANDKRTAKEKLEDTTTDVVTGKAFASGFGGLFKAFTGIDIRSDDLKK